MDIKDLTPELKAKAEKCETLEELLALAKAEGYELTDDEVESISGGDGWNDGLSTCKRNRAVPNF